MLILAHTSIKIQVEEMVSQVYKKSENDAQILLIMMAIPYSLIITMATKHKMQLADEYMSVENTVLGREI